MFEVIWGDGLNCINIHRFPDDFAKKVSHK